MSQPNYKEDSRGWIPQTPKTPKRKINRIHTSVAIVLSTAILVSLFSSAFVVQLIAPSTLVLPAYIHTSASNPPFSTYIDFQGLLIEYGDNSSYSIIDGVYQKFENSFHVYWKNGSITSTKALNMSFSTNAEGYNDENCQVHIALVGDNFSVEKTLDGEMVNGRLMINNNPSIFKINPNTLVSGTQIQIAETSDWRLIGDVSNNTRRLTTAIDDYLIQVKGVRAYHSTANVPKNWLILNLGYDTNTGMLVSTQGVLSDALLDSVGVKFIMDSFFQVVSYSANLDLEVTKKPMSIPGGFPFWITVITPVTAAIVAYLAYRSYKNKRELGKKWKGLVDSGRVDSNQSRHKKWS
jgi:hypothetical protein